MTRPHESSPMLIRPILLLTFIAVLSDIQSQSRGVVADSATQQPIPFVNIWVDGESIGTTSNENGEYFFKQDITGKRIVLSSIGYQKKITTATEQRVILLQPEIVRLTEAVVKAKKKGKSKYNTIGEDFKVSDVRRFFFCGESPYIAAKYFSHQQAYSKTPYVSGFEIVTSSPLDSAWFNIRLYATNENGGPDQPICADNILAVARKGVNLTRVDLTDRTIEFPTTGLWVAVEFLIIDSNQYTFSIPGAVERKETAYMPALGTVPTEEEGKSWIYSGGTWQKIKRNKGAPQEAYEGKFSDVAVRIVLTD